LDSALARTSRGMVRRNIDPYQDGLVHRPNSEEPGDAVSEAQAYGMIVSLYSNDQATFNRVWDAAEKAMWNSGSKLYDWRIGAKGGVIGTGMATDADQDIALMLLFADSLARKGVWKPHTGPKGADYRARAKDIIANIWNSAVVDGRYLAPGSGWGGKEFVNPGYFSPASYRIFAKVDPGHNWISLIDQCYMTLFANPGASKGLLPDWMVPTGSYFEGSLGYNAFRKGQSMYKDAIRVHWRLAMDWLWFGDARAKRWLDAATTFIQTPDRANFYTLDGLLLPVTDTFSLGDGQKRSRREYSELTVGMWACAAFSSQGPEVAKPWSDALLAFQPPQSDAWGLPADMTIPDRTGSMPNEEYFEQFLAWFGGAILAGRFSNIWDDLDDPMPNTILAWATRPTVNTEILDFQVAPLRISGALNKPATWKVRIVSATGGMEWSFSQRSTVINLDWNGLDATGNRFPQGWCKVTITIPGKPDENLWVWLSHHRDLRVKGEWLLIDDFSGPALNPNLGQWGSFDNGRVGGTAKIGPLAIVGTEPERALAWDFDLGKGGYQYCGLEWSREAWSGFPAVEKIQYRARAAQTTVVDFHLVQSDIQDGNYFGVLDTIGTAWKVYEHRIDEFHGRLGNRSGKADLSKGIAFRWHIQFDKNEPLLAGGLSTDNVMVGGNMAFMYTAPEVALPRTGQPPQSMRQPPKSFRAVPHFLRRGHSVEFKTIPKNLVQWRSMQGELLGSSQANAEGRGQWTPTIGFSGMVIVQLPAQHQVFSLLLLP
jgi:hypothetical protein